MTLGYRKFLFTSSLLGDTSLWWNDQTAVTKSKWNSNPVPAAALGPALTEVGPSRGCSEWFSHWPLACCLASSDESHYSRATNGSAALKQLQFVSNFSFEANHYAEQNLSRHNDSQRLIAIMLKILNFKKKGKESKCILLEQQGPASRLPLTSTYSF